MYGINEKVYKALINYFINDINIKKVILFGSRAKGNPDICVVYKYNSVFNKSNSENICEMYKNAQIGCVDCKKN